MSIPITLKLGMPASLKQGRRAGVSLIVTSLDSGILSKVEACLQAEWLERPAYCVFENMASASAEGRRETVNIPMAEAGDVFLTVLVRVIDLSGQQMVLRGQPHLSIGDADSTGDMHVHLDVESVGKQDNTQAEKLMAGAVSSDEINTTVNTTVNIPTRPQVGPSGIFYQEIPLESVGVDRWPERDDESTVNSLDGNGSSQDAASECEHETTKVAPTEVRSEVSNTAQSVENELGIDDKNFIKKNSQVAVGVAGIVAVTLGLLAYAVLKKDGTVVQVNQGSQQTPPTIEETVMPKAGETFANSGDYTTQSVASMRPEPIQPREVSLSVKLDKEEYQEGDIQRVQVTVPDDGYLYVASIWADGRVYVYFPHTDHPSASVKKGEVIQLPPPGWKIEMSFPEGFPADIATERIEAVFAQQPLAIQPANAEPREQTSEYVRLGLMSRPYLAQYRGGRMKKSPPNVTAKNVQTAGAFYTIEKP